MTFTDLDSVKGLSEREVSKRQKKHGYNELPSQKQRNVFRILFEIIHEPMFILLVASGLIYFFLGDTSEGLILMSFVVFIIGITVYQEQMTERALEALRNLSSPRALVIRDGKQKRIPAARS